MLNWKSVLPTIVSLMCICGEKFVLKNHNFHCEKHSVGYDPKPNMWKNRILLET